MYLAAAYLLLVTAGLIAVFNGVPRWTLYVVASTTLPFGLLLRYLPDTKLGTAAIIAAPLFNSLILIAGILAWERVRARREGL